MIKACRDNEVERLRKSPIVFFDLLIEFFRCSSNVKLTSKITSRWLWELSCETLLVLKSKGGRIAYFNFQLNITFWSRLLSHFLLKGPIINIFFSGHFLRRYDRIKTCPWNFFKFSWVVHYRKICENQV